tara:strand:- start:1624 stop:1923 length:300 start_codon:yes stop_codon:yes gene_type:complete
MTTETLSSCCQKVKEDSDWSAGLAIHFQQRKIEELEKKLAAAKRESFKTEVASLRRSNAGYFRSARYWRKRARIAEWEYQRGRKMTKKEQDQYEKRVGF